MEANQEAMPSRDDFLKALSNYSECIRPFLRTAQERYVAEYYTVEQQDFDFTKYCVAERTAAEGIKNKLQMSLNMQ